ncbi:hypothetical protein E5161_19095 [Cohnella pontilimi]|uniref:Uncharacterized protein n=1 Tax=Cohnella pontilimi TaxID=2564100 RepID=A0A4V5LRE3_9BACL|nr:hypothetical protein [Cohnella pontilimi]TJY38939.1 hypothetical protein E5161_19095 [Cohnella pontilimi]
MEVFWFLVFSVLEASAIHIMLLRLFRYEVRQYVLAIVISSFFFSFISYVLRSEFDLSNYFSLVTLVYFAIFAFYVLKIPLIWSFAVSIIGNICNFVLQTIILLVCAGLGILQLHEIDPFSPTARIQQTLFAAVTFILTGYLYRKGIGFAFNFDRFRWKAENIVMLVIMGGLFVAMIITFIKRDIYYLAGLDFIMFAILVYLAIRKERADLD